MNDQTIEQEIQAKGKTAPRVTPADIEANIASEHYFTAEDGLRSATLQGLCDSDAGRLPVSLGLLTFCVLVMRNGFTVTGESACASPENFDAEIGCKIARQNAVQKIWPLLGYALRDKLAGSTGQKYATRDIERHVLERNNMTLEENYRVFFEDGTHVVVTGKFITPDAMFAAAVAKANGGAA